MVLTFRAGKFSVLLVLLSFACACSREQQDWRSAESADTVEAYGQFLEQHPDSELVKQARTRLAQLAEDRDWQKAGSADTADAYRQFLTQHPNGKWAQEARIRIQNFALNGLPAPQPPVAGVASATATNPSPGGPVQAAGTAVPATSALASTQAAAPSQAFPGESAQAAAATRAAPPPPTAPSLSTPYISTPRAGTPTTNVSTAAAPTGYGVQLGAFASENAASNEWQQLAARFSAELRGLSPRVVTANTATGLLFRLQAQVADEARARALCDVLKRQSQACVPVLPH